METRGWLVVMNGELTFIEKEQPFFLVGGRRQACPEGKFGSSRATALQRAETFALQPWLLAHLRSAGLPTTAVTSSEN